MEQIEEWRKIASMKLDDFANSNEAVQSLALKTNIPGPKLVRYAATGALVCVVMLSAQKLCMAIFCLMVPLYMSLKALVHKDNRASVLCLNYWAIYAIFTTLETSLSMFLYFIPMWSILRCLILFAVYCPQIDAGSKIMAVISPLFLNYERQLDHILKRIPGGFAELIDSSAAKKSEGDSFPSVYDKAVEGERSGLRIE